MKGKGRFHDVLNTLGVYLVVLALFVVGCLISKDFLTRQNLLNTLGAVTLLGIVAVGVAFVTYSQQYVDLSIPGIMALSGIVAVSALPYGFVASLMAGIAVGVTIGLVNGMVVGYLRVNPIIWTLAMMSVLSGVIRKVYAGRQVYPDEATAAGRAFLDLYHIQAWGWLPLPIMLLVITAVAGTAIMWKTGFGARLKLTGSSYEVARMTGVHVQRTIMTAFVICSLGSSVAGILLTSFNRVGAQYIGKGYDFDAITAVVIGGMALTGGRGNMPGVVGGVIAIALLNNIMSLVKIGDFTIGSFEKTIIQGAIFILVVGINSSVQRTSGVDDA
jgi:ribose/xylose/arabinose/galactoside ABC-type transport system permease subunit